MKGRSNWTPEDVEVERYKPEIKSKLIDKEKDIVAFDEAHFNSGDYQMCRPRLHAGYKVRDLSWYEVFHYFYLPTK